MTIIKGRHSTSPIDAPITSSTRFEAGCVMLEPGRTLASRSTGKGTAGVATSGEIVQTLYDGDGIGNAELTVGSLRYGLTQAGVGYEPRDTSGRLHPDAARFNEGRDRKPRLPFAKRANL